MNTSLDQQSVGNGVGTILAHLLHEARRCALALRNRQNDEALHDFRVSIRRLRTWCQAIDDEGLALVPKSCRRRLKKLVTFTNETRDLDVHIAILKTSTKALVPNEKKEARKTANKWKKKVLASRKKVILEIGKLFSKIDSACVAIIADVTRDKKKERLSSWIASTCLRRAQKLDALIKSIESVEDEKRIHKARLCAKALRYLAEPFTFENSDAQLLVDELRRFQDIIGNLRDFQTLVRRLNAGKNVDSLKTLLNRAQTQKSTLLKKFEGQYLKGPYFQNKAQLLFATAAEQP